MDKPVNAKKKTYEHLDPSTLSKTIPPPSSPSCTSERKKILIKTEIGTELREHLKKFFLPLLIRVFEKRQMIQDSKMRSEIPSSATLFKTSSKTPQEVLSELEILKLQVEEAQRWCDGALKQICKGIEETKEMLGSDESTPIASSKNTTLFKKIFGKSHESF